MKVKQKYRNALNHYLEWITDDFLRPKFEHDPDGIAADEAMLRWETYGEALPGASKEPELLAKYVQGKTSRDFYIKNWKEDVKQGQAWPEEFLYTLGFNEVEFNSVFGREPEPMTVFALGMRVEFVRLTKNRTEPMMRFLRAALEKEYHAQNC